MTKMHSFVRIISNVITLSLVNQIGMGLSNTILDFSEFTSSHIAARKLLANTARHAVGLESPLPNENSLLQKFSGDTRTPNSILFWLGAQSGNSYR